MEKCTPSSYTDKFEIVETHPVIVTIRDNRDYIRVLLYSYYTTIAGWGVLLVYAAGFVWLLANFKN